MSSTALSTSPMLLLWLRLEVVFPFLAMQSYIFASSSLIMPIVISIGFVFLNTAAEKKYCRLKQLPKKFIFLVRWAGYNALLMATATLIISCIACYNSNHIDFSKLYLVVAIFAIMWLFLSVSRSAAVLADHFAFRKPEHNESA